jgi:hypothetical protein
VQHPLASKDYTPLIVVMYVTGAMQMLMERTPPYKWQYLDVWDEGTSSLVPM